MRHSVALFFVLALLAAAPMFAQQPNPPSISALCQNNSGQCGAVYNTSWVTIWGNLPGTQPAGIMMIFPMYCNDTGTPGSNPNLWPCNQACQEAAFNPLNPFPSGCNFTPCFSGCTVYWTWGANIQFMNGSQMNFCMDIPASMGSGGNVTMTTQYGTSSFYLFVADGTGNQLWSYGAWSRPLQFQLNKGPAPPPFQSCS